MNLSEVLKGEIFPVVEKPSRYLGTELNAVHKDKNKVELRLALAFPDLYDLGLGNLGLHILYAILNEDPRVWCERAYAPGLDLEKELRDRDLLMFANESHDTLDQFDGLGFTLQSELTYTNILNLIQMAGISMRTKDRKESDPLTFAGGPAVFNPEPIAPFMDFFVIGDGEDAVRDLARVMLETKGQSRSARLQALAQLEGVYVPALYPMELMPDGQVLPPLDAPMIRKRITRDLDGATFPVDYIVPFTQQVHDRVSLEVLRGCTQGCRFCQAGMTTRPVRERTIDNIEKLMERTLERTGYEEVSLVSLSTCDYSKVRSMVDRVADLAKKERVSISLPSLRLDSFSVGLADRVSDMRRTGLTFAPEAASPRLRAIINKWIPDEELLEMSAKAYGLGWGHIKLYFMIGLPTERDDDIEAIADLTLKTLKIGRGINSRARVNTGVSTFVPKPFTPFQWAAQIDIEETERKQGILDDRFRYKNGLKFGRHNAKETFLEGLVTRGDRSTADLIEAAFKQGARFDAWSEHLDFGAWERAIEETGFDVAFALRERDLNERLPWDHIDILMPKSWFQEDYARAMELKHAEDCRHKKCHKCGVIDVERDLCAHMLRNSIDGRKEEEIYERPGDIEPTIEPPAAQRVRLRIGRVDEARFLSHLEFMNAWLRSLRRARAPLSYTQGFHAHPRVQFSAALPTGEESTGDYMDIMLAEKVDPDLLLARLRATMPKGFMALGISEVAIKSSSLQAAVAGCEYSLITIADPKELAERIGTIMEGETAPVMVKMKGKRRKGRSRGRAPREFRELDMKPYINDLSVRPGDSGDSAIIDLDTVCLEGRMARPRDIVKMLDLDPVRTRVLKRQTRLLEGNVEVQTTMAPAGAQT
ncbi:MAG: radical SAM family uncharacterized protein/radical SAM-linked protein [Cognaticolwellia sp.]|jgi:radical SAM family uncharacterized protein/radical SAM-linked protein